MCTNMQENKVLNIFEAVKDFVEGKTKAEKFFNELYKNSEMETAFSAITALPNWCGANSLHMFLIEGNYSNRDFVCNARELLGLFLKNNDISFNPDKSYETLLNALPDWLDLDEDYFADILDDASLTDAQKTKEIKKKIKSSFRYLNRPPEWLQSPEWAFRNGKPLIFVGQLKHHTSELYVFYCEEEDDYSVIRQYD